MNPLLGQIQPFGFNFAPRGWAMCNGQLESIAANQALFSLLGTFYGGDGRTTFALPDLRGRASTHFGRGPGLSPRTIGQRGGSEYNILNITQLPSHSHTTLVRTSSIATTDTPDNAFPAPAQGRVTSGAGAGGGVQISGWGAVMGSSTLASSAVILGNTGGNQSVNNMQPWLAVTYCIAMVGLFPSRN